MLEFGGFNVFFNVNRCKRNTLVSFHFDRGKFSCSFYPKVLPGFSIQKESAPGDVIWRTGKKNFKAVSHSRARPYVLFPNSLQHFHRQNSTDRSVSTTFPVITE